MVVTQFSLFILVRRNRRSFFRQFKEGRRRRGQTLENSLLSVDGQSKILGHDSLLSNALHASGLERSAELLKGSVGVELGSEGESSSPGEDGSDGVGGSLVS